jgi:predicted house-cleaning NTP pyrophosphatase (Maf/HAM1 superfamily)
MTTYNGWTNYATWRVNLEMFDCFDALDYLDVDADDMGAYALSKFLQEFADDTISDYGNAKGLAVDYARAFLSDVNWHEISENLLEDAREARHDLSMPRL